MLVGALFLSLNTAPTEEMIEIAYTMTTWHGLGVNGGGKTSHGAAQKSTTSGIE
jgi:hypothetical protein